MLPDWFVCDEFETMHIEQRKRGAAQGMFLSNPSLAE